MKKYHGAFIKNEREIACLREANRMVANILDAIGDVVAPGLTTQRFEEIARDMCATYNVKPAFLGYCGYPYATCCSVNEQVVHGFPSSRLLQEGDIVSVDMGVVFEGFVGDAARTFPVGEVSEEARRLMQVTEESLYIGIDKGMQSLSSVVGYGTLIFAAVLLFIGPTEFILNNITNSVGLIAQNFFEMSLSTNPFGSGSFTKGWTVYYWLWWISYAPGCALFVTRVSAGRKIREVICALIIGGGAGCWFFFGVLESYSIHSFLHNVVDMVGIINQASAGGGDGGNLAVVAFLSSLPFGKMFLLIFLLLMIIFLASHVDAIAYTMAATSTRNLEEGQDPSRNMKLFWCIVITLIPLAILCKCAAGYDKDFGSSNGSAVFDYFADNRVWFRAVVAR